VAWKQAFRNRAEAREAAIAEALKIGETLTDAAGRFPRPVYFATMNFNIPTLDEAGAFLQVRRYFSFMNRRLLGSRWPRTPPQFWFRIVLPTFEVAPSTGPHIHCFLQVARATKSADFVLHAKNEFAKVVPTGRLHLGGSDPELIDRPLKDFDDFARVVAYITKQTTTTPLII
jgi:hypothetical protein